MPAGVCAAAHRSALSVAEWPAFDATITHSSTLSSQDFYSFKLDNGERCSGHTKHLTLLEKTMDNLQVGDVLTGGGNTYTVQGLLDKLVFVSDPDNPDIAGTFYTIDEVKQDGFKLEEKTKEMTVADLEKLVGSKVKIVWDK